MTFQSPYPPSVDDDLSGLADYLFTEIALRSADIEGVSRPAFSTIETDILAFLIAFAQAEGLACGWDEGRNAVFSLPQDWGAERYVLVGSHIDSVPCGGNFDGLAGVLAGLLCLVRARRLGLGFAEPVRVIALRGEESAWFGSCYLASKALLGRLTPTELAARHRGDGRLLAEHMQAVGIDLSPLQAGQPLLNKAAILAYLEVHIEQGPVLVERNLPAAIVTGIRGNLRYRTICCRGEAGHSGAVPLAYRHDPVLAMADLLMALDAAWRHAVAQGQDLVLTSGVVSTDPQTHALSRIPDSVTFSLDIRSQTVAVLHDMQALLQQQIQRLEAERGVRFTVGEALWTQPALCSPALIDRLSQAARTMGLTPLLMASGAGHDAAVFANCGIPTGLVFIRNRNGSHNPAEAMDLVDFNVAFGLLFTALSPTAQV